MKTQAVFFTADNRAQVREIEIPAPGPGEVQARTLINGICMFDVWQFSKAKIPEPYIPGHEGIGVVTAIGDGVADIREGDLITTCEWSGLTNQRRGDTVKLTCVPEHPESYLPEPLACAVIACSNTAVYPADTAILFGAGYMGLLMVQMLRRSPLSRLVVVDVKQANLLLAREFGADEVIDASDPAQSARLREMTDSFDIAFECSGAPGPLEQCTRLVKRGGKICVFAWHHENRPVDMNAWHEKGLHVLNATPGMVANERRFRCFEAAERLLAAGRVDQRKLVTHTYPISQVQRAMEESVLREGNFIKSVLVF